MDGRARALRVEWGVGPVYARKEYEGDRTDAINEERYRVLKDQLDIYNKDRLSWSIWLYKDIGFQGMVYVSRETPYMKLFKDFLAKKHRLALDAWGADDSQVRDAYQPLIDLIKREVEPSNQTVPGAGLEALGPRRPPRAQHSAVRVLRAGVGGALPGQERAGDRRDRAQLPL
ncbi:hypothetical protein NUW54_g6996 [Trametes sanguinea]|uniref:Uncharacterized protein n=1 Tax=Trametes sanguinea TaxID=158606 RepID=A0ACC1PSM2_9APHY|nr:hypothetical protein NUW54_g6996 [Trametes sanguinea]